MISAQWVLRESSFPCVYRVCTDVTSVRAAILPRWRCRPEEDFLGEEPRPAVSALRLVSVHTGHRQAHQEVCPVTERSGYFWYSSTVLVKWPKYRIPLCLNKKLFFFLSVHGGKGIRYTANEDTPPDKRRCRAGYVERAPQSHSSTQLASQVHARALTQALVFSSFTASGVDAVGEVVMCVDILPQPNGEHKINVKGEQPLQITSHLVLFQFLFVFIYFCNNVWLVIQWWQLMTWNGRHRASGPSWKSSSLALTSVTKRGSLPPNPRTTAGLLNSTKASSSECPLLFFCRRE